MECEVYPHLTLATGAVAVWELGLFAHSWVKCLDPVNMLMRFRAPEDVGYVLNI